MSDNPINPKTMKKIKINYRGNEFEIDARAFSTKDYYGNPIAPKITIDRRVAASMIKQYVKKNYPSIKVWAVSDSFSMGTSVDVWICKPDGGSIISEVYHDIMNFGNSLQAGYFNGMEDIYEYKGGNPTTDDGILIDIYTKYVHVTNRPKTGSIEAGLKDLKEGESFESALYWVDENKKGKFYEAAKKFNLVES